MNMNSDETYLLLLLSDSNLPTGSFVASSGFESYIKHGFGGDTTTRTTAFMRDSISAYARSALPFVSDSYQVTQGVHHDFQKDNEQQLDLDEYLRKLQQLDELYDAMTLNHVAKRASKSQGVALLTLYSKGFSAPDPSTSMKGSKADQMNSRMARLVARFKSLVRADRAPGHLPICWGIFTGALGLTLERSQYLHIFLHARSLLSASVRLNEIGPYNAQQILLHVSKSIIEAEVEKCRHLRTGIDLSMGPGHRTSVESERGHSGNFDEPSQGPANTWPLGEILAARHDLQHSRIFNS